MHAAALRLQHGAQEGADRALAVGARDMDDRRQCAVRGLPSAASSRRMRSSARSILLGMQRQQALGEWRRCRSAEAVMRRIAGAAVAAPAGRQHLAARLAPVSSADAAARDRVGRSSWRCTTMSIMPCSSRYSARWKPSGRLSADGLRDDARAGKADLRARLGDLDVAQHGVGGADAAGGGIGQHHDIGQARFVQHVDADGGARHLHQRQNAFLHARAAGGDEQNEGALFRRRLPAPRPQAPRPRPARAIRPGNRTAAPPIITGRPSMVPRAAVNASGRPVLARASFISSA